MITCAGIPLGPALQRLERFQTDLAAINQRIVVVGQVSRILGRKFVGYPALQPIQHELGLLDSVLSMLRDVQGSIDRYKQRTWKELRFEAVAQDMAAYAAAARALPSKCHTLSCYKSLSRQIEQFSSVMPLLLALSHPTVTLRHWRALELGMNSGIPTSSGRLSSGTFQLQAVLATPLLKHRALVESITYAARKEAEVCSPACWIAALGVSRLASSVDVMWRRLQVETKLSGVVRQWESAVLTVAPSVTAANNGHKLMVLHQQSTSELLSSLEEAQVRTCFLVVLRTSMCCGA